MTRATSPSRVRPHQDHSRDPIEDALALRSLAKQQGILLVRTAAELTAIAERVGISFGHAERALDAATWRSLGAPIPGQGKYQFFMPAERAA